MSDLDTLILNKFTLNSGYIFFKDKEKTKKTKDLLRKMNIDHTEFVSIRSSNKLYGFKVFRMRNKVFRLAVALEEISNA